MWPCRFKEGHWLQFQYFGDVKRKLYTFLVHSMDKTRMVYISNPIVIDLLFCSSTVEYSGIHTIRAFFHWLSYGFGQQLHLTWPGSLTIQAAARKKPLRGTGDSSREAIQPTNKQIRTICTGLDWTVAQSAGQAVGCLILWCSQADEQLWHPSLYPHGLFEPHVISKFAHLSWQSFAISSIRKI